MCRPSTRFTAVGRVCRSVVVGGFVLAGLACGEDPIVTRGGNTTPPPPQPNVRVASVTPSRAPAGSPDLPITIVGENFDAVPHLRVGWAVFQERHHFSSTLVSSTQVVAVIPAALLAAPASASIFLESYKPADPRDPESVDVPKGSSNGVAFTVE